MATALMGTVSCSNEALEKDTAKGDFESFTLRLSNMDPVQTKALTGRKIPGEDARNENTITHVDYFFFGDEAGTSLLYSGRLSASDLTAVSGQNYTYEKEFDVTNDFPNIKYGCYAYVVANYPKTITATTLEGLMALTLTSDWTQAQSSFVMDTYDSKTGSAVHALTPKTTAEVKTIDLPLTRVAAKIVVNLKIAKTFTDKIGDLWEPVVSQINHQFVNFRKTATLAGTPSVYSNATEYGNTSSTHEGLTANDDVTVGGKEYYSYTVAPYYTYPQTFNTSNNKSPYVKFQMQWVNEDKGSNNFYYKFLAPELTTFERNRIYMFNATIDVIGGTEDDFAELVDVIYVADWWAPAAISATYESAKYLSVVNHSYTIYGEESITVPVISSDDIQVRIVSSSQQTVKETLGTTATKSVTGASVTANGKDSFTLTHPLSTTITTSDNPSFDCTPITFVVEVKHATGGLTKTEQVTIVQYPPIYASLLEGGNSFVNGYYSYQSASVTPTPSTEQRAGNNQFYRVANNGTGRTISGGGYTGASINGDNYGYMNNDYNYDGKNMTLITVTAFPTGSDSYTVASSTGTNAPVETSFKYIIGDPRQPSGYSSSSLFPYLWGNNTVAWDESNAAKIMVGARNGIKNIIAPVFLVSSGIAGRPSDVTGMNSYDKAEKRCATYQEQGYPAGRWRLPTEAETFFMYSLQRMNVIDQLYSPGSGYYTTSGNIFGWNAGLANSTYTFQPAGTAAHSVRCIYDIWYWGKTAPGDLHTFNPGNK